MNLDSINELKFNEELYNKTKEYIELMQPYNIVLLHGKY